MFKVAKLRTIWWPVAVQIPQDGGKTRTHEFDAEFEIPAQPELEELSRDGGDILQRYLTGNFKRVKDEAGEAELPNGEETKRTLLDINYVRNGLLAAFFQAYNGRAAARKN